MEFLIIMALAAIPLLFMARSYGGFYVMVMRPVPTHEAKKVAGILQNAGLRPRLDFVGELERLSDGEETKMPAGIMVPIKEAHAAREIIRRMGLKTM